MVDRYKGIDQCRWRTGPSCSKDWGRRQLTFPISYVHLLRDDVLLNIECDQKILDELTASFRFSDAVLRQLVVKMDEAVT